MLSKEGYPSKCSTSNEGGLGLISRTSAHSADESGGERWDHRAATGVKGPSSEGLAIAEHDDAPWRGSSLQGHLKESSRHTHDHVEGANVCSVERR